MSTIKTVGILGAGKLGVTLAQLALSARYDVYIAGSGSADKIALSTKIITPGAHPVTAADAVRNSDVVVLALPFGKFRNLESSLFDGKLVIDAMNHWYEVDGALDAILPANVATSEAVQRYLSNATVVKALNHMGYHHLRDEAKKYGAPGRKAIAVAGDDAVAVRLVMEFVDSLGFTPLAIGKLRDSRILESGGAAFGASLTYGELSHLVDATVS